MLRKQYREVEELLAQLRSHDSVFIRGLMADPNMVSRQREIVLSRRYGKEDYFGATDYLGQKYRGKFSRLFYSAGSDRN